MRLQQVRNLATEIIDHHGLVAAVSRDIGIAEKIQCMEGIAIVKTAMTAMITNLNDLRCKIIRLFGETACQIYGIQLEIAGM